jgi:Tfp pilus assembly protein PilN
VPRSVLAEHLETLAAAGLDPSVVGVAPLALPALCGFTGDKGKGDVVFLDMGERRTSVVWLRNGLFQGMRTLNAELDQAGGGATLARELRWTLLALGVDGSQWPSRVFLCGGGAYQSRLQHELSQALEAEVIPFQQLVFSPVLESQRQEQGIFAVCLGLGLAEALRVTNPNVNLRRGEFAHQEQQAGLRREFSRIGWLTAGVGVAAGVAFGLDMYRLGARYQVLRGEIRRVFSQTLPEVHTIVNEKLQLQEAVTSLESRRWLINSPEETAPLELLRQLSLAVPEQVTLDLDEWTFDGETVRLRGMTNSFDAVETIKTAAHQLGLFREVQVKEVKSTAGNKKVSFGLQLFLAQGVR